MTALGLALGALASLPADAAEPLRYRFGPESTVTYHVSHPIHGVTGVSRNLSGTIAIAPGASPELVLPVRLAIPIASFDSGNRNRDRNMLSIMKAARFPDAILVIDGVRWISKRTEAGVTTADGTASGSLALGGVTRPLTLTLSGSMQPTRLEVVSRFSFSMSEYGLERPSLLFQPIDDRVEVEVSGVALR